MFKKVFIVSLTLLLQSGLLFAQYDLNHFYYAGRQALSDGKYSKAIENLTTLSRLDSTNYEAYFFRGIAKYNLGDFTGAMLDFDRSLHFNPVYTPAYHYRGITNSRIGRYDEALSDIQEAIELRPNFIGFYFSRGVTYFFSQQFNLAIRDFNKYIRKVPDESDAYIDRGACHLFLGDTTLALNDFDRAISLNTNDPDGYVRRSRIYAARKEYVEALGDLDTAIDLDTTNTFAYFNRALLLYETGRLQDALNDLNRVLRDEPGNALTLYNRALILSNVGNYADALDDYDRVININPDNVLAYFNRAALFVQMGKYQNALADYSKAIELYPDFAQAYMNRAYVRNMLGQQKSSRLDYQTAQKKIAQYKALTADSSGRAAFADTARKYDALLALDAEFAGQNFDNELIQFRDVDIRLKPLFKFRIADSTVNVTSLDRKYENQALDAFISSLPVPVEFTCSKDEGLKDVPALSASVDKALRAERSPVNLYVKALVESRKRQYNSAQSYYDKAIEADPGNPYFLINRGALLADMIVFISSMDNGVQVLSMDDTKASHTRVQDKGMVQYDYSPALKDMLSACDLDPESPFVHYNLGNLSCLSGNMPEAIQRYSKAIEIAPSLGEAFYNRGLVQIYLKDKGKGCIDLSVAGELGIEDAYSVIKKYCKKEGMD